MYLMTILQMKFIGVHNKIKIYSVFNVSDTLYMTVDPTLHESSTESPVTPPDPAPGEQKHILLLIFKIICISF